MVGMVDRLTPSVVSMAAVGELVRSTPGAWMVRPPTHCPRGHLLRPGRSPFVRQRKGNSSIAGSPAPRSPRRIPGSYPAFSPFVGRRQVEHASRTPHEGCGRDRKDVPAGLPVGPPAEAFQCSAQ
jgi:hypothetical protein